MARGRGRERAHGRAASPIGAVQPEPEDATARAKPSPRVLEVVPRGRGRGRGRPHARTDTHDSAHSVASEEASWQLATPLQKQPPVVVIDIPRRRMITRALLKGTSPAMDQYVASPTDVENTAVCQQKGAHSPEGLLQRSPSFPRLVVGGVMRCVCNAFLVSTQESLLECQACRNWCHPACVGVDYAELRAFQRDRNYRCPYCTPAAAGAYPTGACGSSLPGTAEGEGGARAGFLTSPTDTEGNVNGFSQVGTADPFSLVPSLATASGEVAASHHLFTASRRPPVARQVPLKLKEVPDRLPGNPDAVRRLQTSLRGLHQAANEMNYDVIALPNQELSEAEVQQCLDCCADAVRDATFSDSYPVYCLKEVRSNLHPYVQGTLLKCRETKRVVSMVLSNGMDGYGNLRPTITQLKCALNRGRLPAHHVTPFMSQCIAITDISEFVHITISATHPSHQRRGLAQLCMAIDLHRWALRGRTKAFLNMAIEKRLVDGNQRVEYVSSPASRRLYERLGFADVFPRYDPETGKERWTAKEADMGRVMANLSFTEHVLAITDDLRKRRRQRSLPSDGNEPSWFPPRCSGGPSPPLVAASRGVHATLQLSPRLPPFAIGGSHGSSFPPPPALKATNTLTLQLHGRTQSSSTSPSRKRMSSPDTVTVSPPATRRKQALSSQ